MAKPSAHGDRTDDAAAAHKTDSSLVRHYLEGEDAAATALYLRYAARLRGLARVYCSSSFSGRFDADDVVQSVFRSFFRGTRRQEYAVPPGSELWALLTIIAINKIRNLISHHRAQKRAVHHTVPLSDMEGHPALAADESAAAFLKLVLQESIESLPESNRDIIRMRIEGYDVAQIAERTRRSRRTVERVLQDFRARLSRL